MTSVAKTVRTLLQNLGDAAVASYSSVADSPRPIPALVIQQTNGQPVTDCRDTLIANAVSVVPMVVGDPCALVMQANLAVTVVRCIPNLTDAGNAADAADQDVAALSLTDDLSTLWYGLTAACRAGTLWPGFVELSCADTTFTGTRPGASGGLGWWTLAIRVNVTAPLPDASGGGDGITAANGDFITTALGEHILAS